MTDRSKKHESSTNRSGVSEQAVSELVTTWARNRQQLCSRRIDRRLLTHLRTWGQETIATAHQTGIHQAVAKDLTSSWKFSGSCVLTLQTIPKQETRRPWDRRHQDPDNRPLIGNCLKQRDKKEEFRKQFTNHRESTVIAGQTWSQETDVRLIGLEHHSLHETSVFSW